MSDGSRWVPPQGGIRILVDDPTWHRLIRDPVTVARRAAALASAGLSVVLTSDATVKHLNARHRGRNKATNVLTFDPPFPGQPGEIMLASGVVAREARAAGKRPADHLAHLVIHGALHLAGHDHDHAGPARRMEQEESRLLARLRRPNPWKRS